MKIEFNYYPNGKKKALTMSYDDGQIHDRRLVELFNKFGIKGTFHLNSGNFGKDEMLSASEIASLFEGHEVSAHTFTHPFLTHVPNEVLMKEILDDRASLEKLVGYPVRGMSYPFGAYNQQVLSALPLLGIEYSRTVNSHGKFGLPENFLEWHPTCHHKNDSISKAKEFLNLNCYSIMPLLYVWGHSYEFDRENNWELIEELCKVSSNDPDVWYATNIEIYDYIKAMRALKFSADSRIVINQSSISVWIGVDNEPVEIKPGAILDF